MIVRFIDDHQRSSMGSSRSVRVLPIAPSTYHDHVLKAREQDPDRLSARCVITAT